MKSYIKLSIVIGILCYGAKLFSSCNSSTSSPADEPVTVGKEDLSQSLDENETIAGEVMDLRKDLFSILVAMNSITSDALTLERSRETNGTIKGEKVADQIHAKMGALREQFEEARKKLGQNEKLQAELGRLEQSFYKKEREIRRLNTNIAMVDDEIEDAIKELESENEKLREKNVELRQVNDDLTKAKENKIATEQRAWIDAGDEIVNAARTIPRPHSKLSAREQSYAIVRAKQELLNFSKTGCYNVAIRLKRDTPEAREAYNKALKASEMFDKVTDYQDIGESTLIEDDDS